MAAALMKLRNLGDDIDYVGNGTDVIYFPAVNHRCNVVSRTCSCGCDCIYLDRAIRIASIPGEASWSDEELGELANSLRGTTDGLKEHIAYILGLPFPITNLSKYMDDESYDMLTYSYVDQCERCGTWKVVDEMSEDVPGVCLDCVR